MFVQAQAINYVVRDLMVGTVFDLVAVYDFNNIDLRRDVWSFIGSVYVQVTTSLQLGGGGILILPFV